jgi:hypothetical protein
MSAVAQLVRPKGAPRDLHASLKIGGTHDPQEHEAEHAARVVAAGGQYRVHDPGGSTHLRSARVLDPGGAQHLRATMAPPVADPAASGRLRRAAAPGLAAADAEAARRIEAARSAASRPLAPPLRARLERGFGQPLDAVQVHTGPTARAAAASIGARAYTEGNRITLGPGESEHDLHLMAHETTHVVQNRAGTVQRSADPGELRRSEDATIRRLSLGDVLDWLADKANNIPGFRMFTIILGVNPVNMATVDRSPANILRAVVELMPGGGLIVQALDKYGVFDKAGAWISQQIDTLGLTGASIGHAVSAFIGSLGLSDLVHPGDIWDRAKRIFTDPIDRITAFIHTLVDGVIAFVKDAVVRPLAALASKTRAWDLLTALLGKNPITGDPVPQTAETLIGGFMKLIGQDDVWENLQKSNAVARAFAWFKGAMATLVAFASQVPTIFLAALKSFAIADLLDLPGAIARVLGMVGDFVGRFLSWAGDAVWNLLEIVFDVVSPGAFAYVKKTGAALRSILKNPLPFVGNLVRAAKLGLQNFAGNIGTHLKTGLIDWLTGALEGVYIPKAFSLIEVGKFALSVLGITWAQIRGKIVKALGPTGEKIMAALEKSFDVVVALVKGGPAAAWEVIKDKLASLQDTVVGGIIGFVVDTIVKKAIPKLVSMFIPGAGFISAIVSIYDTVMVFVQKLSKIAAAVAAFVDSIVAIAAGLVENAATKVETTLAGLLSLAISFLAGFLGLGNIAAKVKEVIEKVRAVVDKALDTAIAWIVGKAKSLFARLFGKDGDKGDKKTAAADKLDATATQSASLSLGEEGHTLYARVAGGQVVLEMASTAMGEMDIVLGRLNMLCAKALDQYAAALAANPEKKAKIEAERQRLEYYVMVTRKNYVGEGSIYKMIENIAGGVVEPYIGMTKAQQKAAAEEKLRSWLAGLSASLAGSAKLGFAALEGFKFKSGYVDESGLLLPAYQGKVRRYFYGVAWDGTAKGFQRTEMARLRDEAQKRDSTINTRPNKNDFYWSEDATGLSGIAPYIADIKKQGDEPELDHKTPLGTRWSSAGKPKPGNDTHQADRDADYQTDIQLISARMNNAKRGPGFSVQVGTGFRGPADPP